MTTTTRDIEVSLNRLLGSSSFSLSRRDGVAAFADNSEGMVAQIEGISRARGVDAEKVRTAVKDAFDARPSGIGGLEASSKATAAAAYENIVSALGGGENALRVAAEVSGLHKTGSTYEPIKYAKGCEGQPTGIYGYLTENTTQLDGGSRVTHAFVPAPDALASVLTAARAACGGQSYPHGDDLRGLRGVPLGDGGQVVSPTHLGGR